MSIAEKLQTIAENEQRVYETGYEKGKAEGGDTEAAYNNGFEKGKQTEQNKIWSRLQSDGAALNYAWMFAYSRFSDDTYNPMYDIICSESSGSGQNVFYATKLTDTKVDIYANSLNITGMFYWARNLITIRKLVLYETTECKNAFTDCAALKNITIEGVIGDNFNISASPLTKESITSIIDALSATVSGKTVTFSETAVNNAFGSSTSEEWLNLIATKSNWTISLV